MNGFKNGKPIVVISLTQPPIEVLEVHDDEMQCVIECPYCHQRTTVGESITSSGFIGCPNCYFVPGGLCETVEYYRNEKYEEYCAGEFYKRGFIANRDLKKKIYAFDFDGTIVTNNFPEIGMPILNTIELIEKVRKDGHYIILNTMREDETLMKALLFCRSLGIEFDAVNDNLPHMKEFYKNNPRKIFANYYIDDHNMFVLGVNDASEDLKIEQNRHEFYKHEYYSECDRAEALENELETLKKELETLRKKEEQ